MPRIKTYICIYLSNDEKTCVCSVSGDIVKREIVLLRGSTKSDASQCPHYTKYCPNTQRRSMILEMSRMLQKTPRMLTNYKRASLHNANPMLAPPNAKPPNTADSIHVYFLIPGFLACAFSLFSFSSLSFALSSAFLFSSFSFFSRSCLPLQLLHP